MVRSILSAVGLLVLFCRASLGATEIVIDPALQGRVFEGIGGVSAGASTRLLVDYPPEQQSEVLDFLFKPGFGAAFQHLKVEIGGEVNSTDGTEMTHMRSRADTNYFRGYEWWLLKEAKKRNPNMIFHCLVWGTPAWIGDGNIFSPDYADYIINFIQGGKQYHDIDFSYVGIWNERRYDIPWIKYFRRRLNEAGLSKVQIIAADELQAWDFVPDVLADPELSDVVYAIGSHYPGFASPIEAQQSGKRLWASEDGGGSGDWLGTRNTAQILNRNYAVGKMTLTEIWALVTSYYDALPIPDAGPMLAREPWSGHYEVQPAIWAIAHTTQFAQPGWRYLAGSATQLLPPGGSIVTLESTNNADFSVIVETFNAAAAQTLNFKIRSALSTKELQLWRTTSRSYFEHVGTIPTATSEFSYSFEPEAIYTLTTTTNASKGMTEPPSAATFPLPYSDDFESYPFESTPKYISDQVGVFEVWNRADGRGKALRQLLTKQGIQWFGEFRPYTVVGDRSLTDYEVRTEVLLENEGFVSVLGRMEFNNHVIPDGYYVRFFDTGRWEMWRKDVLLDSGTSVFRANVWHQIQMQFDGPSIRVLLDGNRIVERRDATHASGLAGFGTGWNNAQFDNFALLPLHRAKNLVMDGTVSASSSLAPVYGPVGAADDDFKTLWMASGYVNEWWECAFAQPVALDRILIMEFGDHLTPWNLQASVEGNWTNVLTVPAGLRQRGFSFPLVRANRFRYLVQNAIQLPSLRELQFFYENPLRPIHINEWMTRNLGSVRDPLNGNATPWFELYNRSGTNIDLAGYSLSTDVAKRRQFVIPSGYSLAPGGYLVVWADGRTLSADGAPGHLYTPLEIEDGGTLGIYSPDGDLLDFVKLPRSAGDESFGSGADGGLSVVKLTRSSPGSRNERLAIALTKSEGPKLRLDISGAPFGTYRLEERAAFGDTQWSPGRAIFADSAGKGVFEEELTGENGALFYRVASQ